jgi:hypothetical protein
MFCYITSLIKNFKSLFDCRVEIKKNPDEILITLSLLPTSNSRETFLSKQYFWDKLTNASLELGATIQERVLLYFDIIQTCLLPQSAVIKAAHEKWF